MTRRDANEFNRKMLDVQYNDDFIASYQNFYSDIDLNSQKSPLNSPRPITLSRGLTYQASNQYKAKPASTGRNLNDLWKKLTNKAKQNFNKTFRKDNSKIVIGRASISSLPDFYSGNNRSENHRRVESVTVRPLPTIPAAPRNRHTRRPTGPREMPSLPPPTSQKLNMSKVLEIESQISSDLEGLVSMMKMHYAVEDPRLESAIGAKWLALKKSLSSMEEIVSSAFAIKKEELVVDDDAQTAIIDNTPSRNSSADSIENLKELIHKLSSEVNRKASRKSLKNYD
ncbi:hypothetical protein HK103_000154 [Boothiomyces macroporosus]|uniref:Uncharacterized protein n=1 Tax=Boothiomyces macroporosus TaxID=261099 RepID=A0AAD5UN32_9FUNG|nr:hypothetical protein HK103_000154 [Boothiomyces macroporosus]